MPAIIHHDDDDLSIIQGTRAAGLGDGSQGRAHARGGKQLRDMMPWISNPDVPE